MPRLVSILSDSSVCNFLPDLNHLSVFLKSSNGALGFSAKKSDGSIIDLTDKGVLRRVVSDSTTLNNKDWAIAIRDISIGLPKAFNGAYVCVSTAYEASNIIIIPQKGDKIKISLSDSTSLGVELDIQYGYVLFFGLTDRWYISQVSSLVDTQYVKLTAALTTSKAIAIHNSDSDVHLKLFAAKAPLNSPAFIGNPTAPTALLSDSSSQIATTEFVKSCLSSRLAMPFVYYEILSGPLTFTAVQANSTVALKQVGTPYLVNIQYSTDGGDTWNDYTVTTSGTAITLTDVGDTVSFRNTLDNGFSKGTLNSYRFVMTGKIAASGNVQSMLNYAEDCHSYCYYYMFSNCTSLTAAPLLPATQLADNCYDSMFQNCISLTRAPLLPATLLAEQCYKYMFYNCTSLTTAPLLPATLLVNVCYNHMFLACHKLSSLTAKFTAWDTAATSGWLSGAGTLATTTPVANIKVAPGTRSLDTIPSNWTINLI